MTLTTLRDRYRREILRLAERHGARNVRVFGSVARGDDGPSSDVDFVAERGVGQRWVGRILARAKAAKRY